jgi:hypothetical protein
MNVREITEKHAEVGNQRRSLFEHTLAESGVVCGGTADLCEVPIEIHSLAVEQCPCVLETTNVHTLQ